MPMVARGDTPPPAPVEGVDVIVVDYRTPDDLRGFLESYSEFHGPDDRLHIVLVDPTPDDGYVANSWREHFTFGSMTVLTDNGGYGRACNEAATADAGQERRDVIGFFNADTRITPGVLEGCASSLRARREWAAVGPRQVDDYGRLTHAGIVGPPARPQLRGWLQPDVHPGYHEVETVTSVSGAAYFTRREVWEELTACPIYAAWRAERGLPPASGAFLDTPLYYEETWYSSHASAHGWTIGYRGDLCMVHRWHKAVEAAGREPTDKYFVARDMFRSACDAHGIEHN